VCRASIGRNLHVAPQISGSLKFYGFRFVLSYFMCLDSRIGLSIDGSERAVGWGGGEGKHVKLINEKRSRYSQMTWH
jgi:hypothetical protein